MSRVTTLIPPPVACAALSPPLARGRAGNGAPPSRPVQAESSGASTTKRPHRLTPAAGSLSAGLPRLFSLIAYVDITPYFIAFLPIVKSFGMNSVQFGLILVYNLCIGNITPPVGNTLFVAIRVGGSTLARTLPYMLLYYVAILLGLLLVTYIPALTMALPALAGLI